MSTITIPKEYGYVVGAVAGTFVLGIWHSLRVTQFRRAAGINYPKALAEETDIANAKTPELKKAMYLFNCAQRAHYNLVENHMQVVVSMLITGLQYPLTTAGMGIGYIVFRVVYAMGYTRADRENGRGRYVGMPHSYIQIVLLGLMFWTGYKMVSD